MPVMESVTLENFRCFREKQTVRLAPLTLLVGENSTGKTSFLALLRAMSELAIQGNTPNFKDIPYDLGSFDEIAHHRGARGSKADSFAAGSRVSIGRSPFVRFSDDQEKMVVDIDVTFGKERNGTAPSPFSQRICAGEAWIEEKISDDHAQYELRLGTSRGQWRLQSSTESEFPTGLGASQFHLIAQRRRQEIFEDGERPPEMLTVDGATSFEEADERELDPLTGVGVGNPMFRFSIMRQEELFAGAPVRSQPLRTYDPRKWERTPTGDHIPMKIAELESQQARRWQKLKGQLQRFGRESGLFDEIEVRNLGTAGRDPFQLQVRKGGKGLKGPFRNIIDVGYGVSQVLPIVTELFEPSDPTDLYLFQQPEVHLHPSAQAALGSLFCELAGSGRQLVVETHSDHLVDRVRMDVRDKKSDLTPDDVLILFFERDGLDVKIRELWWDENGNIQNAPDRYRRFFLEETDRSIWGPE